MKSVMADIQARYKPHELFGIVIAADATRISTLYRQKDSVQPDLLGSLC